MAKPDSRRRREVPRLLFGAFLTVMLLWTNVALANMGTPLMWAGTLHLVFGNLGLGLIEGGLLALIFKRKALLSIPLMIAANYFSAWVGAFLVAKVSGSPSLDLYNAWRWFWIMVAGTYCGTLLLEWPFAALCFWKTAGWFRKSIYGTLLVQTITYVLLFGWYWSASGTSLFTEMAIVPAAQIAMPKDILLYYISDDDGDVYAWDLHAGKPTKIATLSSGSEDDRLLFQKTSADSEAWDLIARLESANWNRPNLRAVLSGVSGQIATSEGDMREPPEGTWRNFGEVPRLAPKQEIVWEYHCGFWPVEGLWGRKRITGRKVGFSLETPFVKWNVRNATQLPDDKVIFQLGTRQICVLDTDTCQVALLAKGRGPAVVLSPPTTEREEHTKPQPESPK